jgi:hypothetical protein
MVKTKGAAVSVEDNKSYTAAEVQIFTFLSLAVDISKLSASCQVLGNGPQYLLNRKLGWQQEQVDNLKKIKVTVPVRNRALDRPGNSIATILTDLSQLFSTNMKDFPKIR